MSYQFELCGGGPNDGDFFEGEELPLLIRYPTPRVIHYYKFSITHLTYMYSHWSLHGYEENDIDAQDFKPTFEDKDPWPFEDDDFFNTKDPEEL